MVQQLTPLTDQITPEIIYPDSDGQPMADNTKQFRWIVTIKENLEILFASRDDVFVGGNLLWYPVEGSVKTRQAPDVMVVFGRPKGDRGSYKQWQENNIAPQVVFKILSPGNRTPEMINKSLFYQRYGVDEYYVYDPDTLELSGFLRSQNSFAAIEEMNGWVSPCLGIGFQLTPDNLEIYYPDGRKFMTSVELDQLREKESQRAEKERQEKEAALHELEQQKQQYQELLAKLQAKEIDLENL
jgi:Uma2 family endonuclease